ncbi:cytochrome b [Sphingomonas sp. C8-2]|jgi:cytochrome b561|uniref:cytochrome b n=1 Tax=Sphingomonas sp. KC8 TaxID=1030157 RepID=UPI0002489420|nr:cytochrome b [Sphingomonas sp. KC8]ARS26442.1 polyisoprenoid-binding protein [Sphingomonas sp. KC8]QEH78415.1 cytochrome b [Sphingomonas sp. C8-2]
MQESRFRYSTVSIIVHWTIFVLILANATFGGWMEDAPPSEKLGYYQLHKSVGITVLLLSLFRLGWRIAHPWPPFPEGMKLWERLFARGTHILFYVLMIGAPLLGWAAASAGGAPEVPLYGAVPAPNLPLPQGEQLSDAFGDWHKVMVKAIYVVLALHVLGALKHHFIDRDLVLHRMLPLVGRGRVKNDH